MHSTYSVQSAWGALSSEAARVSGEVLCLGLGRSVEAGECVASLKADGAFQVLVPLRSEEVIAKTTEDARIAVTSEHINSTKYVGVTCKEVALQDVFLVFAGDLLENLPESGPAASSVIGHVERWRELFEEAETAPVLTESQQVGLLGELTVLERIMESDSARAVGVWSGPLQHRHDFRRAGLAIEVKSTQVRNGMHATINGHRQLEPDSDSNLYVAFIRFEAGPAGGTIPEKIDRIRGLNVDTTDFNRRLFLAGYRDKYRSIYENFRYSLTDEWWFDADEAGFPRLVPSSFESGNYPVGVENVSYTIDLMGQIGSALDDQSRESVIFRMAAQDNDA